MTRALAVDERDGGRATKNASCREFEDLVFASLEESCVREVRGMPVDMVFLRTHRSGAMAPH